MRGSSLLTPLLPQQPRVPRLGPKARPSHSTSLLSPLYLSQSTYHLRPLLSRAHHDCNRGQVHGGRGEADGDPALGTGWRPSRRMPTRGT